MRVQLSLLRSGPNQIQLQDRLQVFRGPHRLTALSRPSAPTLVTRMVRDLSAHLHHCPRFLNSRQTSWILLLSVPASVWRPARPHIHSTGRSMILPTGLPQVVAPSPPSPLPTIILRRHRQRRHRSTFFRHPRRTSATVASPSPMILTPRRSISRRSAQLVTPRSPTPALHSFITPLGTKF